jgi:hypothetical protein
VQLETIDAIFASPAYQSFWLEPSRSCSVPAVAGVHSSVRPEEELGAAQRVQAALPAWAREQEGAEQEPVGPLDWGAGRHFQAAFHVLAQEQEWAEQEPV